MKNIYVQIGYNFADGACDTKPTAQDIMSAVAEHDRVGIKSSIALQYDHLMEMWRFAIDVDEIFED